MLLENFFHRSRVAVLRVNQRNKFLPGASIPETFFQLRSRSFGNFLGQVDYQLDQVGRTAALQNLHALGDLEGIANRASEWLIHRIEQIRSFYFHRLADVRHRFGELFGFLFRFHERAGPEFNV